MIRMLTHNMIKRNVKMRGNIASSEDRMNPSLKPILNDPSKLLGPVIARKKILNVSPDPKTRNFTNIRKHHTESSEKVSSRLEVNNDRHAPQILFCDAGGTPLKGCSLKDFMEAQLPDFEVFRDSLMCAAGGLHEVGTSVDDALDAKSLEMPRRSKIVRRVGAMRRNILLKQLAKGLSEAEARKLGRLQNQLEFLVDCANNIVIRVKGAMRQSRTFVASQQNGIQCLKPASVNRRNPQTSTESIREEAKSRVWFTRKRADVIPDSMKDIVEDQDAVRNSLKNYASSKQATTIKILHKSYDHLLTHEINKAIALINKFIAITFKNRDNVFDDNLILRLARAMRLSIKKKDISTAAFRNREFACTIKDQLTKHLSSTINRCNTFVPCELAGRGSLAEAAKCAQYRYFVASGNNGVLVKSAMKQRPWWNCGDKGDQSLNFLWTQWYNPKFIGSLPCFSEDKERSMPMISNHFEQHYHISNKKAMFLNMQRFYKANDQDPFTVLPLTFHIRRGIDDPEFAGFVEYYEKLRASSGRQRNIWIIKPGEYSNRGCGISVAEDLFTIRVMVEEARAEGHTCILQKYIEAPLLIHRRKFDIRIFGLVTSVNGVMKGYFYEEGYIRTSCKEYTLDDLDSKTVHLTNDAIQVMDEDYGKYECGNKLSFAEFQRYLDTSHSSLNVDFHRDLLPQIKVRVDGMGRG